MYNEEISNYDDMIYDMIITYVIRNIMYLTNNVFKKKDFDFFFYYIKIYK